MTKLKLLKNKRNRRQYPDGWIGFDLDGTLAYYDPDNYDPTIVGPPIDGMVELARWYLRNGDEVKIATARITHDDFTAEVRQQIVEAIEDWCEANLGQKLPITNGRDYKCRRMYDDGATQVITNTGITLVQLVASLRRQLEGDIIDEIELPEEAEDQLDEQLAETGDM